MNSIQERCQALTGSACPKKANELFYVTHPKASRALLGPFLSLADAECGCRLVRSDGASVVSVLVDQIDPFTLWHAQSNGRVVRSFGGAQ
ncbi:hypothetical protein PP479_02080 [Pseudomonas aeruginosa]|uniref:hypothetical protein n=1 Tax=Pseudomonas aeruginosa TaxID=287 RepID=UPI002B256AB7|nr:hypothetical protein [Pseudomonas aeruginosa]WOX95350.1 hypothetical protein PP479_02080 [Pseudomonas aeruginosa]HBN8651918.1 hypothetical protein [Pseudomonas aeruginosa]HCE0322394.1 hypothetical protein [Pseudomonas aeruginosa]HCE3951678.1 hypothetical protein [Pseudomonas aeruginosa]